MTRGTGSADGPEDIDRAFAEIVAGLTRDSESVPSWPKDEQADAEPRGQRGRRAERDERSSRDQQTEQEPEAAPPAPVDPVVAPAPKEEVPDEDRYIPPEPPPLPKLRRSTIGALVMFAVGLILLIIPGVIGLTRQVGLPLGLLIISAGIGWLVYRMRQGPPPDSGWDDGAQI
ncbi:hypothetical protein [Actinoalloteichus hymeniacidonis]|uniref:DUF308 domain-containing protein n=1 Tax=Actinoalloteichus hymeniacidonis TaxID=340345 RepID=A0AAC9HT24_9PSEU|nr:hypothetical protein [Actinoalloteichus hymeniacidonis]AOS65122.1 hypothetical protein TL08_21675 [Actinoalloteichus hymeniacidonis]MBB5906799.1 hypothetical protein [Actinoalloteichus hymeniacidonis]